MIPKKGLTGHITPYRKKVFYMAVKKAQATPAKAQKVQFKTYGKLQYFGYGTGNFGKEPVSQVSYFPDNAEELREQLSELYIEAGVADKWLPDFVAKDTAKINLRSKFPVTVIIDKENGETIRTTLEAFCKDYGNPVKGTPAKVVFDFKAGSLYPVGVMFTQTLEELEVYSIDNLFNY